MCLKFLLNSVLLLDKFKVEFVALGYKMIEQVSKTTIKSVPSVKGVKVQLLYST